MSRYHLPLGTDVTLAVLAALTSFFTLLSWQVLSLDSSAYLAPLFWFCLGLAASGVALRRLRLPRLLVPLVQLAGSTLVLNRWWAPQGPLDGWVPTRGSVEAVLGVLHQAVEEAGRHAAPVPADAVGFSPVMVAAGCLVALAVDLLACTLRRVPLAGLPLLAVFTAPVGITGGVPWPTFALAALSFVLLLAADQDARLAQWGRNLARAGTGAQVVGDAPHEARLGTLWPSAARLGFAGVGLAVLAPVALPAGQGLLDADERGDGAGGDEVRITDPMVDMRRRLTRGDDVSLVRVFTDDPAPSYLRTSVLDEFDGDAWRPSQRDIPAANRVAGAMPPPPGLSPETPRLRYEMTLRITEALDSTWLPIPYPAASVDVTGDWRYDDDTLDLVSAGDGVDTRGIEYEVVGLAVQPAAERLVSAAPAPRRLFLANTELPSSIGPEFRRLAERVTAGARSPFERAVVLQKWFRSDGNFRYSLEEGSGSGADQLTTFLGTGPESRVGYCEQFSAAMAILARSLGIPARVAVGFLRPEPEGIGTWVYSAHDLHSWPELYFEGAGWIRFEPTPQDRTSETVPTYTAGAVPEPAQAPGPSATATPEEPRPSRTAPEEGGSSASSTGDTSLTRAGGVLGGLLVVVAALLAPRLLRGWARRRRYAAESPRDVAEGGWAELRATAIDLRRSWADGATTRQQAQRLVPAMGAQPSAPLESLALLVERARYSRAGLTAGEVDRLRGLAQEVTATMLTEAGPSARRQAIWLPRSLLRARRRDGGRQVDGAASGTQESSLEQVSL